MTRPYEPPERSKHADRLLVAPGSGRLSVATLEASERSTAIPTEHLHPVRRFQPSLTLGYSNDLNRLAIHLIGRDRTTRLRHLHEAIAATESRRTDLQALGVTRRRLLPTIKYLAALRVLRDLVQQGWTLRLDDEGIYLNASLTASAATDDPEDAKQVLRQSFSFAREAQLSEPSTRAFIEMMERRGVGELFAQGAELAHRIEAARTVPGGLATAIRPVLHLVDPTTRDERLGLRLQDVLAVCPPLLVHPLSDHARPDAPLSRPRRRWTQPARHWHCGVG